MKTGQIVAALVAVVCVAAVTPNAALAQNKMNRGVKLMASPLAKNAGLQGATGSADVNTARGTVKITVMLAPGSALPAGSVLEGWLTTAGKDTASDGDQRYGPAFGKPDVATKSRQIPYALSTGVLRRVGASRTYVGTFKIDNPLTPYGGVAVTLESDGNKGVYDPRPGTPLLVGMLNNDKMMGGMMMDKMTGKM